MDWATPALLGVLLAIASAGLTVVELAEPAKQPGFIGILSNKINSAGARAGEELFQRYFAWLPYPASGLRLSPHGYMWSMRVAILAMVLLQGVALVTAMRQRASSPWPWLVGPGLSSLVLLAYPPVCTDISSYASFGWVAAKGANPYIHPPASLLGDPYASMNDWTHITTPYGPIWTMLSHVLVVAGRESPFWTLILFKIVAGAAAIGLGWLAFAAARRIGAEPRQAVGALIIVAWSPIVLYESAGGAHNDGLMMLAAFGGLLVAATPKRGAMRAGLLLITVAVLIKPVALPLLGLAALMRLRGDHGGVLRLARDWALDLLAAAGLTAVCFAPYWSGGQLPRVAWDQEKRLYLELALRTNQIWMWAVPNLALRLGGTRFRGFTNAHTNFASRSLAVLLVLFALWIAVAPERWRPRLLIERLPARLLRRQTWAWFAAGAGLGLAPINTHTWYMIWAIVPLGVAWSIANPARRNIWLTAMIAGMMTIFLVYNTWPLRVHARTETASTHVVKTSSKPKPTPLPPPTWRGPT